MKLWPLKKHRWGLLGNTPRIQEVLPSVSIIPTSAWCYSVPSLHALSTWHRQDSCSTAGQFCPSPSDPGPIKHQLLFDDSIDGGSAKDHRAWDPSWFITGNPQQLVAASLQLSCWQLLVGGTVNNCCLVVVRQDEIVHFPICFTFRSIEAAVNKVSPSDGVFCAVGKEPCILWDSEFSCN